LIGLSNVGSVVDFCCNLDFVETRHAAWQRFQVLALQAVCLELPFLPVPWTCSQRVDSNSLLVNIFIQ
jgi:hypothetical protein